MYFYHCAILCTLCTVSCSIWTVTWVDRLLLYMCAVINKKEGKNSEKKEPQRRSIGQIISPVSLSYISGCHCVNKIR